MRELQKLVGQLNKTGALSGFLGGVAGGGLTGLATSKSGKKAAVKTLKYGALAAVGGVAWKAYKHYSEQRGDASTRQQVTGDAQSTTAVYPRDPIADTYTPDPRRTAGQSALFTYAPAKLQQSAFDNVVEDEESNGQLLLMRAMISAAYADGHIDESERQRIFDSVEEMELSVGEKAMLFDELRKPLTLEQLVANVPDAQTGIEVYAASASAIDMNASASVQYLHQLASHLCLPRELVTSIHQQLS